MQAFRLDKSTQGKQRLDDAEGLAWRESRTKSGQQILACEWRDGMVRGSGWRSGGPAFSRPFLCNRRGYFLCVRRPEIEPENGGTREISCRRDRLGSFWIVL